LIAGREGKEESFPTKNPFFFYFPLQSFPDSLHLFFPIKGNLALFIISITMTTVIHISSKEQFQQEISHSGVSVIDFFADWCGPCRLVLPVMDQLAVENADNGVKVLKVNVDENPDLAAEFGVSTIPTVLFAVNGEVKEGLIGANPQDVYQGKIDTYLAEAKTSEKKADNQ
jgi:thioredoxin 1